MSEIAYAVLILSCIVALGLVIGNIKVLGIRLGVAGVLFSGLIFGHYLSVNKEILEFIREFGLILFVYTIGMQVGPGFFSSFKKDGLKLNMLAAFVVLSGVVITVLLNKFGHIPLPAAVGLFSGATTNTPSLGAAQQALREIPNMSPDMIDMPGLGYAVAYPFGILGIILAMIITRVVFRIDTVKEAEIYNQENLKGREKLWVADLRVENPSLNGIAIKKIPLLREHGFVVSRILHNGEVKVALADMLVAMGDVIRIVGRKENFEHIKLLIGSPSEMDINLEQNEIEVHQVIVTKHEIEGKTIQDLDPQERYGINVTRIQRADMELPVKEGVTIHLADTLMVVGKEENIQRFAKDVGNTPKELEHPFLLPVFIGIALGVLLGSIPFPIPGVPSAVKLGLAGGPLLVAIVLSKIGRIGNVIWYMPMSANYMLREFGISLFLACVGLKSGHKFLETLLHGQGLYWMVCAALITILPLLVVALIGRLKMKENYLVLCGLLAGSMTDPPALAFANSLSTSSAASIAYTSVYPLVMILRVLSVQILVLLLTH